MLDEVLVARGAGLHTHAAAVLRAELAEERALDIAEVRDGDDHVVVGIEVLGVELLRGKGDLGAARVAVLLLEVERLLLDDGELLGLAGEDLLTAGDELLELVVLGLELGLLETGELLEAHLNDGGGLRIGETECGNERSLGIVDRVGSADNGYDLVDDVDGAQETFEDMGALLGLVKVELRAAHHHLVAEVDEVGDYLLEGEGAGAASDQGDVIDGEAGLERRVLEKGVQHDVGIGVLLEIEHDADALAAGKLLDVGDAFDALFLDHVADALDHLALVHHIGDLGDDYAVAAALVLLDLGAGAYHYLSTAGGIRVYDALAALDDATRREIGTLDVLHKPLDRDVGIVDVGADGVAALGKVVGSHVGGHTDSDAGRAVKEQERSLGGEHRGLGDGVVEVELEIDGILVYVGEDVLGDLLELGLGVSHGRD